MMMLAKWYKQLTLVGGLVMAVQSPAFAITRTIERENFSGCSTYHQDSGCTSFQRGEEVEVLHWGVPLLRVRRLQDGQEYWVERAAIRLPANERSQIHRHGGIWVRSSQ